MVVLEKVDLNQLKLENFRQVGCPCEYCDDGCFDRNKQAHHPECKRNKSKKNIVGVIRAGQIGQSGLSHYKETYQFKNARPSTAYRPNPDLNAATFQLPPVEGTLMSVQQVEFKPYALSERTQPIKIVDKYEKSTEPMNTISSYKAEFVNKEAQSKIVKRNANESTMKHVKEPMLTNTTFKDHFKASSKPTTPTKSFGEYPSYASSSLYPSLKRSLTTTTNDFHHPMNLELSPRYKPIVKDSLKNEGNMELVTNYRDAFVKFENAEKAVNAKPVQNANVLSTNNKEEKKFSVNKTQNQIDFKPHLNHQPPKMANTNPFLSNLDKQLYPGNTYDHTTNYAKEFVGIDTSKFQRSKAFKKESGEYKKPTEKVESESVTQSTFKPIDLSQVMPLKAIKIDSKLKVPCGPMETQTTTMIHFTPYEVKPIQLAKDPNPVVYIPPKSKFNGETTTGRTFLGQQGSKTVSFKPLNDNLDSKGDMDLITNYRNAYVNHGLTICEAKAFLIAKSLANKNENVSS